ncbi:coxsackievirus and adenovirus receptor homolog isoform X3 [Carcharodon carcharias]|uniref:coxsackievirus and adenovirus receptor homolog isoform X3 n=1 Tax=Carcharodon carcharias TaxID=13397 RepID=UPI001B7F24AE|nr:coxsackievirus and adenovirus receptor homolog isoform X3 [Carcharodon carcharias]
MLTLGRIVHALWCRTFGGMSRQYGWSQGLEILPTQERVEAGDGDSVMLICQFKLDKTDIGPLDIEWSRTPSDPADSPIIVIDYSGDRTYETRLEDMEGRVHFSSPDPKNGDASLNITRLKSSDSGRYHCKVKKSPGSKTISITLNVLVRPSKPTCSVEGSQEIGKDIILKCSSQGTLPITYIWTRGGSSTLLPPTAISDNTLGTLKVRNASTDYSGDYICVANNRIASSQCVVKLLITSSSSNGGMIAGIVIAVLLFLLLLIITIWYVFWRKKKKTYEKEQPYEIREDVPAPKSRVSTARSYTVDSQRSSLGSMSPSNMEPYKSHYGPLATDDVERLPNHSPNINPSYKVAAPSLNRMGAVPVMIPAQHRDGSIV